MSTAQQLVTIDGFVASGKSTCARRLAETLNWRLLSTGSVHRFNVWRMLRSGLDLNRRDDVIRFVEEHRYEFKADGAKWLPEIDGIRPGNEIYGREVSAVITKVTSIPEVCRAMAEHLRRAVAATPTVAEGHGLGNGIFPHAAVKFFCDAPLEVRAQRRYDAQNQDRKWKDLAELVAEMDARDRSDANRQVNRVEKTAEMVVIDTALYSVEEAVKKMVRTVKDRFGEMIVNG